MNANDLFDIIGETPDRYVLDATNTQKPNSKALPPKRMWLIAAIIALILCLVGCAIVYVLAIEDMAFGSKVREYYDGSTEEVTLLSLQGIKGTPGYQATKEWHEWLENYDTDGAIWDSHEAYGADFGDEYYTYGIYSQEMKEKLDEICEKYDLKLMGKMYEDPDVEAACEALQIQAFFRPRVQVKAELEEIIYYANGSFRLEEYMEFSGYDQHIFNFTCYRKDFFSDRYGGVGAEGTYEEWTYTTSYGVDVLMVIDRGGVRGNAFMLVDNDIYTYLVSISEFENMPLPDKEELEAYAEAFDFTARPQPISDEDLQALDQRREEADEARRRSESYYMGFRVDMTTQAWYPPEGYADSFESYIPYILKYASPEYHYYTLVDLDGDGADELLWGTQDGYINEVAIMVDGEVTLRFDDYLCEGNILMCELNHDEYAPGGAEFLTGNTCTSYQFNTLSELIVKLYDLPEKDKWVEVRPGQEDRFITEAEAKQIMAQYPIIKLDMKPLAEYPLP